MSHYRVRGNVTTLDKLCDSKLREHHSHIKNHLHPLCDLIALEQYNKMECHVPFCLCPSDIHYRNLQTYYRHTTQAHKKL